jgi:cell division septum initiation protein DivIVA
MDLNEAQDAQAFQQLNSSLNQINATAGAVATNLSSFQLLENLNNQGLQNRINQLNNSLSSLNNVSISQNLSDLWAETEQLEAQIGQVGAEVVQLSNDTSANFTDVYAAIHDLRNESWTNIVSLSESINAQVNQTQEQIEFFLLGLGISFGDVYGQIGTISSNLANLINEVSQLNSSNSDSQIQALNDTLSGVIGDLATVQAAVSALIPASIEQEQVISNLNQTLDGLANQVSELSNSISQMNSTVDSIYGYVDTNIIGNVSALGNMNATALQNQILGNVSNVLSIVSSSVSNLNVAITNQASALQGAIDTTNQRIDDVVLTTTGYLESQILSNASDLTASIALSAQQGSIDLANAVNLINQDLNLLFQNDTIAVYANNTSNPGLYNMFSFIHTVDNSGFVLSASESLYVVVFSNPVFDQSPLVTVALAYNGNDVPQKVSLTLQDLSNVSVSVRVSTIDGSALDTSGNLHFHLIAYGI